MRFRFRGGEDCPDWVLAEISTISKLSSVKLKLICVQVLNHIEEEVIKYEVFTKLIDNGMFTLSDVKALVSGLTFILQSALRNDVESTSLDSELQQLGFPKEHAGALTKAYTDHSQKARDVLRKSSLRYPAPTLKWYLVIGECETKDVDYIAHSSKHGPIDEAMVNLTINDVHCTVTVAKLDVILSELKTASKLIKNIKL